MKFLLISTVISTVFTIRIFRPYYDSSLSFSLNKNKNVVELSRDMPSAIKVIPDESDDGLELQIDGKSICIDDDLLRTCSDRKDKFRVKKKGNGFRIKTETRNFFSKMFFEKCLVREGRELRMKGCEDINEELFIEDNLRERTDNKNDICDRNPELCKDLTEGLPTLPNYPIFNSKVNPTAPPQCQMTKCSLINPAIQQPQQISNVALQNNNPFIRQQQNNQSIQQQQQNPFNQQQHNDTLPIITNIPLQSNSCQLKSNPGWNVSVGNQC